MRLLTSIVSVLLIASAGLAQDCSQHCPDMCGGAPGCFECHNRTNGSCLQDGSGMCDRGCILADAVHRTAQQKLRGSGFMAGGGYNETGLLAQASLFLQRLLRPDVQLVSTREKHVLMGVRPEVLANVPERIAAKEILDAVNKSTPYGSSRLLPLRP